MNNRQPKPNTKLTVSCPSGHRLRGRVEMIGKRVKCPRCSVEFDFLKSSDTATHDRERVATPAAGDRRGVSESRVMAILGDMNDLSSAPISEPTQSRPCAKCGGAVSESLTVCPHCNTYVGVMPNFMRELG